MTYAYRADRERLGESHGSAQAESAWLAVSHTLWRAAQLPAAARPEFLGHAGSSLETMPADGTSGEDWGIANAVAAALRRGDDEVRSAPDDERASIGSSLAAAVQQLAANEEQAGAFALADTTLSALRGAVPHLTPRQEGLVMAQQGRVARQLGDTESADELYTLAASIGRRARAPDVEIRALLGRGVVANMRGNYPRARATFRRALTCALRVGEAEYVRAAHHGLLHAAVAALDVDTALTHGWQAAQQAGGDPDARAEMLNTLAEVCRLAGYPVAALRGALARSH